MFASGVRTNLDVETGMQSKFVTPPLPGNHTNSLRVRELARMMSENPDVADAYEALFGALRLARPLATGSSILVTSAEPGEGKTTVSSCLAITASLAGQTALLIDGDLRRSSLAAGVGIAGTAGLIEILLGQAEAAETIRPIPELADGPRAGVVSFMAGGRKPPVFLGAIDWAKARIVLKSIAQAFDIVLVDSPPILAATDALLLASIVDGVLLVVGAGSAKIDEIGRAKERLDAVGTPIIGAVLNRFEPKVHGPSDMPYRGYYRPAHK